MTEISTLVDRLIGRGENEREQSYELVEELENLLDSKEELTAQELHDVHEFILDDDVCASIFFEMASWSTGGLFEILLRFAPPDEAIIAKKDSLNPRARRFSIRAMTEEMTGNGNNSMAHLIMDSDVDVAHEALINLAHIGVSAEGLITAITAYRTEHGNDKNVEWIMATFRNFIEIEGTSGVDDAVDTMYEDFDIMGGRTWLAVANHFLGENE